MSSKASNQRAESSVTPTDRLDVLADECARTILVATSEGPRTAKELTDRTDSSSATVYRRINDLVDSGLVAECIRFEDDGTHTTAYESVVDELCVEIGASGVDVSVTDEE